MSSRPRVLILATAAALFASGAVQAQKVGIEPTPKERSENIVITGPGVLDCVSSGGTNCDAAIPEFGGGPVQSTFDVASCGTVNDLRVGVDAVHTWVGDLAFTVTSPGGTSVTIIDRPGVPEPPVGVGCSGDNIEAFLADGAATPVEDECASPAPAIDGEFIPNNPLAAIVGESADGTWTLTAEDFAGLDTGNLVNWSLDLVCEADLGVTVVENSPQTVVAGDGNSDYLFTITNLGPADATGVTALWETPVIQGGTFDGTCEITVSQGDKPTEANSWVWDIGDIPVAGPAATLQEVCDVAPSTDDGVNRAVSLFITGSDQGNPEGPGFNRGVADTDFIRVSDMGITKTDAPDPVVAGGQLTYTLTATIDGPSDADNVVVVDTLPSVPAGVVTYNDALSNAACDELAPGVVTCTLGDLAFDAAPVIWDIVVDVDVATPHNTVISNSAAISSDSADDNAANDDTGPVTTTVITQATWEVTKTYNDGNTSAVNVTLACDGTGTGDSSSIAPGGSVILTATGFGIDENCVVTEEVPGGYFEEYSDQCDVDPVVSNTPYTCDIINGEAFATFEVYKIFQDGNDVTPVTLMMQCNNGLPTQQEVTITPPETPIRGNYQAKFVVTKFSPGSMDCTVTEKGTPGYTASYRCGLIGDLTTTCDDGDASLLDPIGGDGPCTYTDVDTDNTAGPAMHYCTINNYPDPVEVAVTKDWVIAGAESQAVEEITDITIRCDGEIVGPSDASPGYDYYLKSKNGSSKFTAKDIEGDKVITVDVIPAFPESDCYADEDIRNSAVAKTSTCGDSDNPGMTISAADGGDSCTLTNTVFFEGIPTLSQYGLAIMALLMLGIGMVGFRRFV